MRIFEPILGEKASSLREHVAYNLVQSSTDVLIVPSVRRPYTHNPGGDTNSGRIDEVRGQASDVFGLQDPAAGKQQRQE